MTRHALPDGLEQLIENMIGAAIAVHRELGSGFQESTYHRAIEIEMDLQGIPFASEVPVDLIYRGQKIGQVRLDLLVEERLVVELKAAQANPKKYAKQVSVYLKATGHQYGISINFEADRLVDGIARVVN